MDEPVKIEKNLDSLIDEYGPELRAALIEKGEWGSGDYKGMHRTAVIGICAVRKARVESLEAQQLNASYGNGSKEITIVTDISA